MNKIGPHFQSNRVHDWPNAVATMAPGSWVKIVDDIHMAPTAKNANASINVVVRFWRDNMTVFSTDWEWSKQHVRNFITTWLNPDFFRIHPWIDAIEDLNEYYAVSQTPEEIQARVTWTLAIEHVWNNEVLQRYPELSHLKWCLANTAVGNDIPMAVARVAYENDWYIGYHGYTSIVTKDYTQYDKFGTPFRTDYIRPAFRQNDLMYWPDTQPDWLPHDLDKQLADDYVAIIGGERSPNEYIWGSGRVLQQDIHQYQPNGIYPNYLFTECGLVRDLNGRGWLQPNDGWKHNQVTGGDKDRYIELQSEVAALDASWNNRNNGRLKGRVLFTSGAADWPMFEINGPELSYLMPRMAQYPTTPTEPPTPPPPPPPPQEENLKNGGFEGGWYHPNQIPELQIPDHWEFRWYDEGTPNPHDHNPWAQFVRPEVRVLPKNQLPAEEQDLFVLEGNQTLKIFKRDGSWYAKLRQELNLTEANYKLTIRIFADLVKEYRNGQKIWADDPQGRDGLIKIELNGSDAVEDWYSLTPGQWNNIDIQYRGLAGLTRLDVTFMCPFPLKNNGLFMDAWTLEKETIMPQQYLKGIDISHWNGELDGETCRIAGNEFVICKATDGHEIVPGAAMPELDPHYATNIQQALNNNLLVGSYHYFQPSKTAEEQANNFLDALTLTEEQHLPPILDFEEHPMIYQTATQLRAQLLTWLEIVEDQTGQTPMIYTNQSYYNQYLNVTHFDKYPLHIASWTDGTRPSLPTQRTDWEFWQWNRTGGGRENGVQSYSVDKNRWEGTVQEFDEKYAINWLDNPTEPPPTGNPCDNAPEIKTLYNVIPRGIPEEILKEILRQTLAEGQTVGYSFDHAGASCNKNNTAVLWGIRPEDQHIYLDWFRERYPYTTVIFKELP